MLRSTFSAIVTAVFFIAGTAFAQDAENTTVQKTRPADDNVQHGVSLTFSPLHLFLSFVELQGEFRLSDRVGVAAIGGAGSYQGVPLFEVGGQARYYAVGSFIHGLNIAAEVSYVHARTLSPQAFAFGNGLSVSPLIGYKIATNLGFTLDLQAGPSFMIVNVQSPSTQQQASASVVGLNANVNLGWSF